MPESSQAVERSKKQHEMEEIIKLVDSVIIRNYEKPSGGRTSFYKDKELEKELEPHCAQPRIQRPVAPAGEAGKKDATAIAQEMLKAFRKELLAGKIADRKRQQTAGRETRRACQHRKGVIQYISSY